MQASPTPDHASRRGRLRAALGDLDALLVTRPVNIRYLTGFTGSAGVLLVGREGDVLATDGRYAEQAAQEAPDVPLVMTRDEGWLRDRVTPGAVVGLESHDVTWERLLTLARALEGVVLRPEPGRVEELRARKDDAELAAIRAACGIGDEAFTALLDWVEPGMTERAVALRLEHDLRERGADDRAFESIVASGPNSARPHHRPTERAIERGDLVKLDFGARVDGYCSDMTRTFALGEPAAELRAVHGLVVTAQERGRAAVRDGAEAADVDHACREFLSEAGYGEAFVHGTGHGIGLEVHEPPILRARAAATLRARMVVTVEPGVYLPGVGGVRIEDTVAVAPAGPDVLTGAPRHLIVL